MSYFSCTSFTVHFTLTFVFLVTSLVLLVYNQLQSNHHLRLQAYTFINANAAILIFCNFILLQPFCPTGKTNLPQYGASWSIFCKWLTILRYSMFVYVFLLHFFRFKVIFLDIKLLFLHLKAITWSYTNSICHFVDTDTRWCRSVMVFLMALARTGGVTTLWR